MMFASTSLTAWIERAECRMLAGCAAEVARRRAGAEVRVMQIAGGVASCSGPGSPLNKVAGLGFEVPVDVTRLEQVERKSGRRNAPVQVELSCPADPSVGELLTTRAVLV
jgi:hypothetical protein